jgi:hypothetical protein
VLDPLACWGARSAAKECVARPTHQTLRTKA